jgi:hypothetical protein
MSGRAPRAALARGPREGALSRDGAGRDVAQSRGRPRWRGVREREGREWEGGLGAKRGRWTLFLFPCFLLSFFLYFAYSFLSTFQTREQTQNNNNAFQMYASSKNKICISRWCNITRLHYSIRDRRIQNRSLYYLEIEIKE